MFIPNLTQWLRLPGILNSPESVWVSLRDVVPEVAGIERCYQASFAPLAHTWVQNAEDLRAIEQLLRAAGAAPASTPRTYDPRVRSLMRALDEEKLWIWRVRGPAVSAPAVFPTTGGQGTTPGATRLTWIEIVLIDAQGRPVPDAPFSITLADGSIRRGRLNQAGSARLDGIAVGSCDVSFTSIDWREWDKQQ